ncbi:hypothetical protein [Streptomyces sp. NPDC055085]
MATPDERKQGITPAGQRLEEKRKAAEAAEQVEAVAVADAADLEAEEKATGGQRVKEQKRLDEQIEKAKQVVAELMDQSAAKPPPGAAGALGQVMEFIPPRLTRRAGVPSPFSAGEVPDSSGDDWSASFRISPEEMAELKAASSAKAKPPTSPVGIGSMPRGDTVYTMRRADEATLLGANKAAWDGVKHSIAFDLPSVKFNDTPVYQRVLILDGVHLPTSTDGYSFQPTGYIRKTEKGYYGALDVLFPDKQLADEILLKKKVEAITKHKKVAVRTGLGGLPDTFNEAWRAWGDATIRKNTEALMNSAQSGDQLSAFVELDNILKQGITKESALKVFEKFFRTAQGEIPLSVLNIGSPEMDEGVGLAGNVRAGTPGALKKFEAYFEKQKEQALRMVEESYKGALQLQR